MDLYGQRGKIKIITDYIFKISRITDNHTRIKSTEKIKRRGVGDATFISYLPLKEFHAELVGLKFFICEITSSCV